MDNKAIAFFGPLVKYDLHPSMISYLCSSLNLPYFSIDNRLFDNDGTTFAMAPSQDDIDYITTGIAKQLKWRKIAIIVDGEAKNTFTRRFVVHLTNIRNFVEIRKLF